MSWIAWLVFVAAVAVGAVLGWWARAHRRAYGISCFLCDKIVVRGWFSGRGGHCVAMCERHADEYRIVIEGRPAPAP